MNRMTRIGLLFCRVSLILERISRLFYRLQENITFSRRTGGLLTEACVYVACFGPTGLDALAYAGYFGKV